MPNTSKNLIKNIIISCFIIVIARQMNFVFLTDDFQISMACCCIAALAYQNANFNTLIVVFISDAVISSGIILTLYTKGLTVHEAFLSALPESAFYIVYGVLICFVMHINNIGKPLFAAFACATDFISNLTELFLRVGSECIANRFLITIFIVAIIRSFILLAILIIFDDYRLTLLKKSNAQRYQRLVVLMSRLTGEITLMDKSSHLVENTMKDAYSLYRSLQDDNSQSATALTNKEASIKALNVAKNIHEIKKEYFLIMRGLSEAITTESKLDNDNIKSLILLICDSVKNSIPDKKDKPEIDIQFENQLYTGDSYFILSIFDNLITNAVESAKRQVHINIRQTYSDEKYIISIRDDGDGISPDIIDDIFTPGLSTKIDFKTGNISRGLGLPIVKDIVEDQLQGHIKCESSNNGTEFIMEFPKNCFREDS